MKNTGDEASMNNKVNIHDCDLQIFVCNDFANHQQRIDFVKLVDCLVDMACCSTFYRVIGRLNRPGITALTATFNLHRRISYYLVL
jgi:hypothetical protein